MGACVSPSQLRSLDVHLFSWEAQMVKNLPAMQETWVRSPGQEDTPRPREGNGNPLQYSCLENSMDRGAWGATVHGIAKSRTRLSDCHFHLHFIFVSKAELRASPTRRAKTSSLRLWVNALLAGCPLFLLVSVLPVWCHLGPCPPSTSPPGAGASLTTLTLAWVSRHFLLSASPSAGHQLSDWAWVWLICLEASPAYRSP